MSTKDNSPKFLFDKTTWDNSQPVPNTPFNDEEPTEDHFVEAFIAGSDPTLQGIRRAWDNADGNVSADDLDKIRKGKGRK